MQLLHENPYVVVHVDDVQHLVRVRRTSVPYPSVESIEAHFDELIGLFGSRQLERYRCLVDVRDATGRNDDGFERVMGRYRPQLFGRFARAAMIVKTAIGEMQVGRMAREHGGPTIEVFRDEAEALRALGAAV